MKTVIYINGPPRSGKDTIANYLEKQFNFMHLSFKEKLFTAAEKHYGFTAPWTEIFSDDIKDMPNDLLKGKTPRSCLIYVAENIIKKKYGDTYFAKCMADTIKESDNRYFVISDGGFDYELEVLQQLPDTTVIPILLQRKGCSFANDSRNYVTSSNAIHITNDNNINELYGIVDTILKNVISN